MLIRYAKQPDETLDYLFDFTLWFSGISTDSIASATVTADIAGLTFGAKTIEGLTVRQFISGGADGVTYKLTCQITTTQGRVKERDGLLQVAEV